MKKVIVILALLLVSNVAHAERHRPHGIIDQDFLELDPPKRSKTYEPVPEGFEIYPQIVEIERHKKNYIEFNFEQNNKKKEKKHENTGW